jgi:hypothetical protein
MKQTIQQTARASVSHSVLTVVVLSMFVWVMEFVRSISANLEWQRNIWIQLQRDHLLLVIDA